MCHSSDKKTKSGSIAVLTILSSNPGLQIFYIYSDII